jgi:hypothetical protein
MAGCLCVEEELEAAIMGRDVWGRLCVVSNEREKERDEEGGESADVDPRFL